MGQRLELADRVRGACALDPEVAVLLGDLVREVEIKAIHGSGELPTPTRSTSGRFTHLAGED